MTYKSQLLFQKKKKKKDLTANMDGNRTAVPTTPALLMFPLNTVAFSVACCFFHSPLPVKSLPGSPATAGYPNAGWEFNPGLNNC